MADFAISSIRILQRLRRFVPSSMHARWSAQYWERVFAAEAEELFQAESEQRARLREDGKEVPDPERASPLDLARSERGTLIRAIADRYPFKSLLEVGCSFGQNFHMLARQYPRGIFLGLDQDAGRVYGGSQLLIERGLANAVLMEGDMRFLDEFQDRSFDLVICSAALLYLSPEEIGGVVKELWRISGRSLLLLEQNCPPAEKAAGETQPGSASDTFHQGIGRMPAYWQRDYERLLKELIVEPEGKAVRLTLTKVEAPRWPTERWKECAVLFALDRK